ncbi:type I-E CRISPR-associated protein Cse2/CasB [Yinghuangia aomiensis]
MPLAHEAAFVAAVFDLCRDPGKRAALRSGLRRHVDEVPARMHVAIGNRVPGHRPEVQQPYYALAAMIASLPPGARNTGKDQTGSVGTQDDDVDSLGPGTENAEEGGVTRAPRPRNFGACLAEAVAAGVVRESAAEARLDLLARQSADGLYRHLPAAVRLIATRPQAVDWAQLLLDMRRWEDDRGAITRRWLQAFYRARFSAERDDAQAADVPGQRTGD